MSKKKFAKTYIVHFSCQGGPMIWVQASNESEAEEKAQSMLEDLPDTEIVESLAAIVVDHIDLDE